MLVRILAGGDSRMLVRILAGGDSRMLVRIPNVHRKSRSIMDGSFSAYKLCINLLSY